MAQIRRGLILGVDVNKYASTKYDERQMCQICKGLESGIDVSAYADPNFSSTQMKTIREIYESVYGNTACTNSMNLF